MKNRVLLASLSLSIMAAACTSPARALDPKLEKYDSTAQQAFDGGDYKKAQSQWSRLQTELSKALDGSAENKQELSLVLEKALRRLGECCLALKNYSQAADFFAQAQKLTSPEAQDNDLVKDMSSLAQVYRQVDPLSLGPEASNALKEVAAEKILVTKNDLGQHIDISLADKVVKPIDQQGVSEIGFDKVISFDISQGSDGEVKIENISGLKVHAAVWVNVIASKLKRNEQQEPIAEVTGQKLGISQSVTSKLPDEIYQPVMALIGKVTGIFNEVPQVDIASTQNQYQGQSQSAPANSSGIIPVLNNSPTTQDTITPILNNGPEPSPSPSPEPSQTQGQGQGQGQ